MVVAAMGFEGRGRVIVEREGPAEAVRQMGETGGLTWACAGGRVREEERDWDCIIEVPGVEEMVGADDAKAREARREVEDERGCVVVVSGAAVSNAREALRLDEEAES